MPGILNTFTTNETGSSSSLITGAVSSEITDPLQIARVSPFNNTGAGIGVSCTTAEGVTFCDLNHYNFSIRVMTNKTNAYNISSVSRNVENSDRTLGVNNNKTREIYPGDTVDFFSKDEGNSFVDVLSLNRNMFVYNKTGIVRNITSANANSTVCKVETNSSTLASASCTMSNDDVVLYTTYISDDSNTHPLFFFDVENIASVNVTLIEYYNYMDCDATTKSGYESRDDIIALIDHVSSADQEEQISKEAHVVCDTQSLSPENDLSKCSVAANDSYYVMQKTGSGTPNPYNNVFCGFSMKYTSLTQTKVLAAFTNPSTDTDNLLEVPPGKVVMSSGAPVDKADITLVGNINGLVLQPGRRFVKYYGIVSTGSIAGFLSAVNESILGVPVDIAKNKIRIKDNQTGAEVNTTGAYRALNITLELANTGGEDLTGLVFNCTLKNSLGVVIAQNYTVLNISATEAAKIQNCGSTINGNNSLEPGVYTANATITSFLNTVSANASFTILSDYNGTTNLSLDNVVYPCNASVNISINTTNIGNTNFSGNVSVSLYQNNSWKELITSFNTSLIKNSGNYSRITYVIDECTNSSNYSVRMNTSLVDENEGNITLTSNATYYADNVNPSVAFSNEYANGSAFFKRFATSVNVADDYAIDTCLLELEKGVTTTYVMNKSDGSCELDINLTSNGQYSFRILVNDTVNHINNTNWTYLEKFSPIPMSQCSGSGSTNVERDVRNAYSHANFTCQTTTAMLKWPGQVNLVGQDVEASVTTANNYVLVNASALHSTFNATAEVTMFSLSFVDPKILVNYSVAFESCSKCHRISFNQSTGNLLFNTSSFSAYASVEGTNLTIYDESDSEGGNLTKYAAQQIVFTANYTNSTSNPVITSGTNCSIRFNTTTTWNNSLNMSYNSSSKLYQYNRTLDNKGAYSYNVTCSASTNANISLLENITLPNWNPTVPILVSPGNASLITNRIPTIIWNNSIENDVDDNITYELMLDNNITFSSPEINTTLNETLSSTNHTPYGDLEVDTTYYWRVRAYDKENYSEWTNFSFELLSLVSVSLPNSSIAFGSLNLAEQNDTTQPGATPLLVSNDGNIPIKIFVNATRLFVSTTADIPGLYQFNISNNGTTPYASATSVWTNLNATQVEAITNLRYKNNTNQAYRANIQTLVRVPSDEPYGPKNSTIYIRATS